MTQTFRAAILQGLPKTLPEPPPHDTSISHAPKRRLTLGPEEKKLAVRNALRYFEPPIHATLAPEFLNELETLGRIYMHRFRPTYPMHARRLSEYPAKSKACAAIMLMIQNNLDPRVAQHPHELITYGGNGAVFQNWAQYLITMKYLATMTDRQTLVMYSGHPMGLFPSEPSAPRVIVTNGMMIPNYSRTEDYDRFNALGVTQYGQMTAGSYMYIGPQGIVHGTTLTLMNAARKWPPKNPKALPLFVSSGLGGMSGAQPKAARIAQMVGLVAEINPKATHKRHAQGWVDEVYEDVDQAIDRALQWTRSKTPGSIAYSGNVVDLWERLADRGVQVDLGSDQTSLHNPWAGGYFPKGLSFEQGLKLMVQDPAAFKTAVQESLRLQCGAIAKLVARGMAFFDYGNAFLLEASRAGAPIQKGERFIYPSYVEELMGPQCFDHGFGPFRWVCTSGDPRDLALTDQLAAAVLKKWVARAPKEIRQQLQDNLTWIRSAEEQKLVVGSQARILYADAATRIEIAQAFNRAIAKKKLRAPVVLGRDHHDVSGTDSPFRETANIDDGSRFTADMAVQNFVGDAFRGATWVSLHNGGGVGWGEVVNGGFGLVIDGSADSERRLKSMLFWDVNNGVARRAWAGNTGAQFSIEAAMKKEKRLQVTRAHRVSVI